MCIRPCISCTPIKVLQVATTTYTTTTSEVSDLYHDHPGCIGPIHHPSQDVICCHKDNCSGNNYATDQLKLESAKNAFSDVHVATVVHHCPCKCLNSLVLDCLQVASMLAATLTHQPPCLGIFSPNWRLHWCVASWCGSGYSEFWVKLHSPILG